MIAFWHVLLVRTRERTIEASDMDDELHNLRGEVDVLAHISFARGELTQD